MLSAIVGLALLTGTILGSTDLADAAKGGLKTLVDRVAALEDRTQASIKYVVIEDDVEGHALGWNPDGDTGAFTIIDLNVSPDSYILFKFIAPDGQQQRVPLDSCRFHSSEGSFIITCDDFQADPADGSTLDYAVINPS